MAVNWPTDTPWFPVPGIRLASAAAGIRYSGRDDVVLIALATGTTVAALFTRNAFVLPRFICLGGTWRRLAKSPPC